jgi:hypothetical protein
MFSQFQKGRVKSFLLNPIVGSLIAGLAIIAGFVVSLYSNELKKSFPLYFSLNKDNYGSLSIPTLIFWFIFIVFFFSTALLDRPAQRCHPFRSKLTGHSGLKLPPVPA